MLKLVIFFLGLFSMGQILADNAPIALAIHGGAGSVPEEYLNEHEHEYRETLQNALLRAYEVLSKDGTAQEAVTLAVRILEDSPLFNAGKGSALDHTEQVSMDAAIMLGHDRSMGSVMGCQKTRNPILLANAIRTNSSHVILSGIGADEFAKTQGLPLENPEYFKTSYRLEQLKKAKEKGTIELDHVVLDESEKKFGTVGAVALDKHGHLAAATSTGGLTNKQYGRIGDSPILGAGTFADDRTCAISATGRGELFIQNSVASEVHYRMLFRGESLEQSVHFVVHSLLPKKSGGVIALNKKGDVFTPFNTKMMFRGVINKDSKMSVDIL